MHALQQHRARHREDARAHEQLGAQAVALLGLLEVDDFRIGFLLVELGPRRRRLQDHLGRREPRLEHRQAGEEPVAGEADHAADVDRIAVAVRELGGRLLEQVEGLARLRGSA